VIPILSFVCPFLLFPLAIVLSVLLRYTDSDYPFDIFKLFSVYRRRTDKTMAKGKSRKGQTKESIGITGLALTYIDR
jgi:hypothetical protein